MPVEENQPQVETKQQPQAVTPQTSEQTLEPQGVVTKDEVKLVKEFPKQEKKSTMKSIIVVILILSAGVTTGYFLSGSHSLPKELKSTENVSEEGVKVGDVFGMVDEKTFRDSTEGILVKGGIDGEGSHHLLRPGGVTQSVYLTSSTIDLDLFVDHKIKIWGETFQAQKAGWLMDVGRAEVIELNAEKPIEE